MKGRPNKKVLFMPACEGVSHAGRMLLVARALRHQFDGAIEFAGNGKYGRMFPEAGFPFHEIEGEFSLRAARRFQYERRWSVFEIFGAYNSMITSLRRVIDNELRLYQEFKPDLVVWDGRFTPLISTEVAGVPNVSVVNPAMLPYSALDFGIPKRSFLFIRFPRLLFLTRMNEKWRGRVSSALRKGFFHLALRTFNKLRAAYGLSPHQSLEELIASLPAVILPDSEMMSPTVNLPQNLHYVGPLVWQPEMELPPQLKDLRDIIYVTMGSTGSVDVFKHIVAAFSQMPGFQAVITTGGLVERREFEPSPDNVRIHSFLPGAEMARRARLMICHGAPATIAQALSHGVPVIGIPFNVPQEWGIDRIASLGAGVKLDLSEATPETIAHAVREVLSNGAYRNAAAKLAPHFNFKEGPVRAAEVILGTLERDVQCFTGVRLDYSQATI